MFGFTSQKVRGHDRPRTFPALHLENLEARDTPAVITVDDTYSVEAGLSGFKKVKRTDVD